MKIDFNYKSAADYGTFLKVRQGYVSLGGKSPKTGKRIEQLRRFYGCELKPEYHKQALKNLAKACEHRVSQEAGLLF